MKIETKFDVSDKSKEFYALVKDSEYHYRGFCVKPVHIIEIMTLNYDDDDAVITYKCSIYEERMPRGFVWSSEDLLFNSEAEAEDLCRKINSELFAAETITIKYKNKNEIIR